MNGIHIINTAKMWNLFLSFFSFFSSFVLKCPLDGPHEYAQTILWRFHQWPLWFLFNEWSARPRCVFLRFYMLVVKNLQTHQYVLQTKTKLFSIKFKENNLDFVFSDIFFSSSFVHPKYILFMVCNVLFNDKILAMTQPTWCDASEPQIRH